MVQMSSLINPRGKVVHFTGRRPPHFPFTGRKSGGSATSSGVIPLREDYEAGVEIDPRRLDSRHVVALRDAGFNRASFGVQDF